MKKLIFGLILSAGMSGIAMAGTGLNHQGLNASSIINNNAEIENSNLLKPSDCWYAIRTDIYNCEGNLVESFSHGSAEPCRNGDEDGTISIRIHTMTLPCD